MTGILDRLEAGGWIIRERDPNDRRKVSLRVLRTRAPELVRLYSPMNSAIGAICEELTTDQLDAVHDFLVAIGTAANTSAQTVRKRESG
jgi:DNA-binding MarR family transcriptional regulator